MVSVSTLQELGFLVETRLTMDTSLSSQKQVLTAVRIHLAVQKEETTVDRQTRISTAENWELRSHDKDSSTLTSIPRKPMVGPVISSPGTAPQW